MRQRTVPWQEITLGQRIKYSKGYRGEVKQLYCTECGNKTEPGMRYCPHCGAAVAGAGKGRTMPIKTQKLLALGAVALVGIIVLAIIVGTGIADRPERTVRTFMSALEQGDVNRLTDTLEPAFFAELEQQGLSRSEWEEAMGELLSVFSSEWQEEEVEYTIVSATTSGDTAEVSVRISNKHGEVEGESFKLVRLDNKWYIEAQWFNEEFGY